MAFPSLETIVKYGIYSAHQLKKYHEGLLPPKQVTILSECDACDFVYEADGCPNCLGLIKSPKADSNEL
jgi:hypothetical protein